MTGVHTKYPDATRLEFPPQISLWVLLSGRDNGGGIAVFEDAVQPGVGPGRA